MKIAPTKITHLLATNVAESLASDWIKSTTYVSGQKAYVLYSDFPELINYGSCIFETFTEGVGWTYDGTNSAYASDGSQAGDSLLTQITSSLEVGAKYLSVFEVQAFTAGNITTYAGGGEGTDRTAIGWYAEVITAGATDSKIGLIADLDFVGRVSNISFKQVTDYVARNIYESQAGANTNQYPPDDDGTYWVKISASNRWKMFDDKMSSKTEILDKLSVKVKANKTDTLAFFLLEATGVEYIMSDDSFYEESTTSMTPALGSISFVMSTNNTIWAIGSEVEVYRTADQRAFMIGIITAWDSGTGDITITVDAFDDPAGSAPYTDWTIAIVYNHETADLVTKNATSWKQFYFGDFVYSSSKTYTFSLGFDTSLRVIFTNAADTMVRCGHMVVARGNYLGKTEWGVRSGFTSLSTKEVDAFGHYSPVKRANFQEQRYTIRMELGSVDINRQLLASLDTIPCVFEGNNDDKVFDMLTVFAFIQDYEINLNTYNDYELDIELQELA